MRWPLTMRALSGPSKFQTNLTTIKLARASERECPSDGLCLTDWLHNARDSSHGPRTCPGQVVRKSDNEFSPLTFANLDSDLSLGQMNLVSFRLPIQLTGAGGGGATTRVRFRRKIGPCDKNQKCGIPSPGVGSQKQPLPPLGRSEWSIARRGCVRAAEASPVVATGMPLLFDWPGLSKEVSRLCRLQPIPY